MIINSCGGGMIAGLGREMRVVIPVVAAGLMILGFPASGTAQEKHGAPSREQPKTPAATEPDKKGQLRRLEVVTWNPATDELTWVVSALKDNQNPNSPSVGDKQTYVIRMDRATMMFKGETRGFSRQEADRMQVVLDFLSRYAVESTVWWEVDQGSRVDQDGRPIPKHRNDTIDSRPLAQYESLPGRMAKPRLGFTAIPTSSKW